MEIFEYKFNLSIPNGKKFLKTSHFKRQILEFRLTHAKTNTKKNIKSANKITGQKKTRKVKNNPEMEKILILEIHFPTWEFANKIKQSETETKEAKNTQQRLCRYGTHELTVDRFLI